MGRLEDVCKDAINVFEKSINALEDWVKKQVESVENFVSKITN